MAPKTKPVPVSPTVDVVRRRVIVFSFWAMALLGVPYWYNSTAIERLELPNAEVESWLSRGPCFLSPPIVLDVSRTGDESHTMVGETVQMLRERLPVLAGAACVDFDIKESDGLRASSDSYQMDLGGDQFIVIADRKVELNGPDNAFIAASLLLDLEAVQLDPRVVKFAAKYKLVFSLLNEDAASGEALLDWDIENLLHRHLQPLLASLAPLHSFTVESRIQYFAPLTVEVEHSSEGALIVEDELRAFVNAAEWNMPSSVTLDPILHFILYVPSVAHRPMRIQTNSGALSAANGFISPQAGGVVIYNPPSRSDGGAPALPDLNDAFRLFEQQIQKLFGVPKAGQTSGSLPPWQVDAMVRARLLEAAKETVETLDAIVKLAESLPNMRVGKEVQRDVHLSLQHLEAARIALPHSLRDALQHASTALSLSSKAYFNPTMLALLYFPDEHKYAVYTPFFGPVAVPLLGALFKEIKEWKERRRIRNAAEKARKKDEAEGKKKKSE